MKHKNYFKVETDKHRSPAARMQQRWDWLRKMKKEKGVGRKAFVYALNAMMRGDEKLSHNRKLSEPDFGRRIKI